MAITLALIKDPYMMMSDKPTGNQDKKIAISYLIFLKVGEELMQALLIVTTISGLLK